MVDTVEYECKRCGHAQTRNIFDEEVTGPIEELYVHMNSRPKSKINPIVVVDTKEEDVEIIECSVCGCRAHNIEAM